LTRLKTLGVLEEKRKTIKAGVCGLKPKNLIHEFVDPEKRFVSPRQSDPLFRFSYLVFSIKFVIIELVFLGLSLYGLYQLAMHELGFSRPSVSSHHTLEDFPSDARSQPERQ
jgi:hypothetical protein